jgi:hypothetical protein
MMGGVLVTSIISGNLISRFGRYRFFPIAGTAIMTVGLFLLSRLAPSTSTLAAALLDGWRPEEDEDLSPVLQRMAHALVHEMPSS